MARTRAFDETVVVRALRDLFWQQGYAATSIGDLETATGLNRSSLYSSFGSKRELFARATAAYLAEVIHPSLRALEAPGAGPAELAGYFRALADVIAARAAAGQNPGCLVQNSAGELAELDTAAADVVRAMRERITAAFGRALRPPAEPAPGNPPRPGSAADPDGRADPSSIRRTGDPDVRAELLSATQAGLLAIARTDPDAAVRLARRQAEEVETW